MRWHQRLATRRLAPAVLGLLAGFSPIAAAADAPCVFVDPSDAQAGTGKGFAANPVEQLGAILSIKWTTAMTNYTIALWQQNLNGGAATLGPIVFQTTEAAVTQFDWPVQLYSFKLSTSPVFFLWLREGPANLQGVSSAQACTSHYFNITNAVVSSSSSTSATTSSATTSATTASSASSTSTASAGSASSADDSSGGLSTGAQAGIGVGVGIVGVAAIAAFIVWYRYIQKKKAALDGSQGAQSPATYEAVPAMSYYPDGSTAYTGSTPKPPPSEMASSASGNPAGNWPHHNEPVEMGASTRSELP